MDFILPVYMSWGMWVAKCPRPGCHNAERFGQCDDGSVGGLTGRAFHCRQNKGGCGLTCGVDWPDRIEEIEFMLRSRPLGAQSWFPGETVDDLLRENVEHGLMPKNEMDIIDGRITILREIEYPEPQKALEGF